MSECRVHHMKKQKQLPAPSSQRTIEKLEKKELQKYTPDEAKSKILYHFHAKGDLDNSLRELGDDFLPKILHGNEKEKKEARKILNDEVTPVLMALEVDSHWGLISAFSKDYWGMAKELASQIINENKCTTHTEKLLVEVIVNAFIRTLDASKKLNEGSVVSGGSITENRTKYISMLSKEHDRANRQFLTSLMTLKQFKAPNIEMNIKANTAFVAQNQQINAPKQSNEINESK